MRLMDAERTEKCKNCLTGVHPVMTVVSVAMNFFAERKRMCSVYVMDK